MATTINFKANNTTQYSINGITLSSICKKLSSCSRGISSSKLLINIEEREKKALESRRAEDKARAAACSFTQK